MRLQVVGEPDEPSPNQRKEQAAWLAEVGSIGAGRAVSRLSDLIGRRCLIDPPQVVVGDSLRLFKAFNQQDVLSVAGSMRILGEIPGYVIVLLRRAHAHLLLHYLTRLPQARGGGFDFTSQFALRQLTDVLTVSFCGNVYRFLRARPWYGMPEMVSGPWPVVLRSRLQAVEGHEPHMAIYTWFYDEERSFKGTFLFVIDAGAQQKMIERIRLLLES